MLLNDLWVNIDRAAVKYVQGVMEIMEQFEKEDKDEDEEKEDSPFFEEEGDDDEEYEEEEEEKALESLIYWIKRKILMAPRAI